MARKTIRERMQEMEQLRKEQAMKMYDVLEENDIYDVKELKMYIEKNNNDKQNKELQTKIDELQKRVDLTNKLLREMVKFGNKYNVELHNVDDYIQLFDKLVRVYESQDDIENETIR